MNSILLIATIQSWFFIFLIQRLKTEKQLSDYLLTFWFGLVGLHTLIYFILLQGVHLNIHIMILNAAFPFLQAPLFYMYTLAKTGRLKKNNSVHYIHLIPFILFVLFQLFQLHFPAEDESGKVHYVFSPFFSKSSPFGILFLILTPAYLFLSYRHTLSKKAVIESKTWIRLMILFFVCIWASALISFFRPGLFNHQAQIGFNYIIFILLTGFIYLVSYVKLKENYFTTDIPKIGEEKYKKSRLSNDEILQIWTLLSKYMIQDKFYLDPDLNLIDLANKIGSTYNKVSQVINLKAGKSFNDYINTFRVEHAKEMMASNSYDHYTILAIAYDSGFSSKSTFNRAFKNIEGKTPSEFHTLSKK